ncbi:MAG TPA: serine/threonine-protein kinase, partial [Streptosporangiaceae bacterium]
MSAEVPPAIGDFLPGARIAGYRIEQLIGRGGMAVVYRATDVRLDRMVALKILNPDLARNDSFRQRFIRESRAGAAVDHPHVIPVFEAGEAQDVLFIAMRYVSGLDVRALIERLGKLPADRTVELVTQVASALDTAHAAGLVHRDVKPANMLLAVFNDDGLGSDYVYLSDFGLSKQSISSPSLTMTGQFLGTLDYMSPEQVNGRQIDGKTDQYALGCAAYEMLTGEPPFRREANLAVMWAQVSAQPPSVRTARPDLSARVDEVIGKALAKAPEDRFATCIEFAAALREACAVQAVAAGGLAAPGGVTPPVRNPTELVAGVGGVAGVAGAAGVAGVAGGS